MSSCLFCASLCPRKFTFVGEQVKKLSVENDNNPLPHSVFNFGKDSVIKEQLKVIFTLKNILGIEHDQLCAFLGSSGKLHPEFWISVCPSCEETVGKYFEVVKEVERLEKVLVSLSKELKRKIWKSKDEEGQGPTVMLWDTIRSQTLMEGENLFEEELEEEAVISEPQSSSSTQGRHLDSATEIVIEKEAKEEEEQQPDDDDESTPSSGQEVPNDEIEIKKIIEEGSLFEEKWHLEQKENVNDATQSSVASVRTTESEPEADTFNDIQMTAENNVISHPSNTQPSVFVRLRDVLTETRTTSPRPSSPARNEVAKAPNLRTFDQKRSKVPRMKTKEPPAPQISQNQTDKPTKSMLFKKQAKKSPSQKIVSTKGKGFTCPKCPVSVTLKRNLGRHMKEKHPTVREVFCCDICNAKYSLHRTLLQHQELHHSDFRGRKCRFNCGKSFLYPQSLSRHEVVCRKTQKAKFRN